MGRDQGSEIKGEMGRDQSSLDPRAKKVKERGVLDEQIKHLEEALEGMQTARDGWMENQKEKRGEVTQD